MEHRDAGSIESDGERKRFNPIQHVSQVIKTYYRSGMLLRRRVYVVIVINPDSCQAATQQKTADSYLQP